MNNTPFLQVAGLSVQIAGSSLLRDISFTIAQGESLAIIGASGSGKTSLLKALAGQLFGKGSIDFNGHPRIALITQQHQFKNLSNTSTFYYQQRFNSCDAQDAVTVEQALLSAGATPQDIDRQLSVLKMEHTRHSALIQLSNGEHKRLQLAKALLQKAEWLLLDSPYTGLDVAARKMLNELIDGLVVKGVRILLVTSFTDIPASISHVGLLVNGELKQVLHRAVFEKQKEQFKPHTPLLSFDTATIAAPVYQHEDFTVAIKMVGATVRYDNRKVLDNIHWEVKKGECWSVSGHNGSGKSTLLSLVNGDNPQAFANEIYLFDRKKGTGETIWEIKQKIGYVSPELHHYFEPGISCFQVVASGLFDTIGLFRNLGAAQQKIVDYWLDILQIKSFSKRLFKQLSNGEQRKVLLARALVKNPPLLILDEPCQGLDAETATQFIVLINTICVQLKKTLIYVSHYEAEIPSCVTHALKLEQGKIAA
jgi:molybdate transport system ATP-binding protein